MTTREILDNLSDGLLRDDRILSGRERQLLADLLRRATLHSSSEDTREALARALGETLTERAYSILGDSLIQRLLESASIGTLVKAGSPPTSPPSPGPTPGDVPPGPHPPGPNPPGNISQHGDARTAVLTRTHVLLDEFLAPAELNALTEHVLAHEADFCLSEVISPGNNLHGVDLDHRRSRVLTDLGEHQQIVVSRLQTCLPQVLEKIGISEFPIKRIEAQVTASNHGDFFRCHTDNGAGDIASRDVTFVYFFHREPCAFHRGELRIYESRPQRDGVNSTLSYQSIVPEQNQMVVFPSSLAHEITPVECPSGLFADSRFTVNGWLHR
jgi:Rps23 Pro-64 3,4-dihydroxylase Tpa1-like proline 4-hydroxylase